MINCTLGEKKYTIDFVSERALRELEPAATMRSKIVHLSQLAVKGQDVPEDAKFTIADAMDIMVKWFCVLFNNQFTPDEMQRQYTDLY